MDKIIIRFLSRVSEITTVLNKPTLTGFKVWAVAQDGFVFCGIGMFLAKIIDLLG
jgi:hypothetical protein